MSVKDFFRKKRPKPYRVFRLKKTILFVLDRWWLDELFIYDGERFFPAKRPDLDATLAYKQYPKYFEEL